MDEEFALDAHDMTALEAEHLCESLRTRILDVVSQTGGHLGSNLGVIELTVALHRVYHTQRDRIVFDVGHQCYAHKILTGRDSEMATLRTLGGLSGYPKPSESDHDAFVAGHASNSVSVALGMARARTIKGEDYSVIALIGDGALTGGLAYEGLSNAGQSGEPMLVILNDNGMSITANVGGMADHLAHQRLKPQYLSFKQSYRKLMAALPFGQKFYQFNHKVKTAIKETLLPCSFFENMGFTYLGPVDGHDVELLTELMQYAKEIPGPVLLHIRTVKGKGYTPAVENPDAYHGVSPFDLATGKPKKSGGMSFSSAFGGHLVRIAKETPNLCAITAAMRDGTGLGAFETAYPERFFDVGIAEGHGVAMAAGMARQGAIPVFAVYSSFLQRGYDMLLHDVAIQHLHCIFAVDRAGLVGEDGETHHGLFDVAYLTSVPGMTLFAPSSFAELGTQLQQAITEYDGPVAIRYPRGGEGAYTANASAAPTTGIKEGKGITLVTYGTLISTVLEVADRLTSEGFDSAVIKLNRLAPLDIAPILSSIQKTGRLLIAEEVVAMGGMGQQISALLAQQNAVPPVLICQSVGNQFVPQGTVTQLRALCGLDVDGLYEKAKEALTCG